MRRRLLPLIVGMVMAIATIGVAHSSWVDVGGNEALNGVSVGVPSWDFGADSDFARIDNVGSCSYLTATKETALTKGSHEAIRLTNTAGTQTKAHTFNVSTDRDYTLGEIRFFKVEFDYYHAEKRQQVGKGFPKVQLLYNNATKGSDQGGGDSVNEKSPFIATNIDENWWHLEYFITALCPTMADHQDTPISTSQKINGIRVTDSNVYDYGSKTAFVVVDNMRFSSDPAERLGLFNRTTSYAVGTYYWMKVCWVGELQSVTITTTDETVATQDTESTKSPFYIKGLKKGTVTATATVTTVGGQVLSISNAITVT